MSKLVVVIQCHLAMARCSGYNCMKAFYKREGKFSGYGPDVRYMMMTCGGCSGAQLAARLENLLQRLRDNGEDPADVVFHLGSCICSDSHHRPPCPHLGYLQAVLKRKGYTAVLGTYISRATSRKRELGIYSSFE